MACDFFIVDTVWLKQLYALFFTDFIELTSRRRFLAGCTEQPTRAWVTQQARNLSCELGQAKLRPKLLTHGRDSKFVSGFDEVLRSEGVRLAISPTGRREGTRFANAGSDPHVARRWTGC